MKAKAIIFSPIVSIYIFGITILILSINSSSEDYGDLLLAYIFTNFIAIGVQLFVEVLLMIIENWTEITFKIYLNLATIICVMIGLLTFFFISDNSNPYTNLSNSFISFSSFFTYSILNAFTYNYLYFSKLIN